MEKLNMISGLPRAGSTLLCQILNSNPNFHVTPTSGVLDMIKSMRANFSQNPTWRAQNRMEIYENFRMGLKGFIEGFFYDSRVVFDKNRAWPSNLKLYDTIMQDSNAKIIWLYRNPAEIVSSIEHQYQKTFLMENMDEATAPGAFLTLDRRISTYVNADGIISFPVEALKDALEMGFGSRIMVVKYFDLTNNTQEVLNHIHDFIGEPRYEYDLNNIKQTTSEYDGIYNYKFPHSIREGEIKFKKGDYKIEEKFIQAINKIFEPLNKLVLENDYSALLHLPPLQNQPEIIVPEKEIDTKSEILKNTLDSLDNPFKI